MRPFIADATLTLVRRLIRGERVWQAHREHYYQRMVRSGLGHRGTAYVAYGRHGALRGRRAPRIAARVIRNIYHRRFIVFAHDLAAAALAWVVAFWLRFNLDIPDDYLEVMVAQLPWVLVVHAAVFWALGLYRGLWRYASLPDLKRIVIAGAWRERLCRRRSRSCASAKRCRAPPS